jgi:hypothetical protein
MASPNKWALSGIIKLLVPQNVPSPLSVIGNGWESLKLGIIQKANFIDTPRAKGLAFHMGRHAILWSCASP